MPVDGLTLGFLARECDAALRGGRVDRVNQPDRYTVILNVRSLSENYRLLISADTNLPRVQLTSQSAVNPQEAPMFCMLLRKRLQGSKLTAVRQVHGDRVIWIDFETMSDFGDIGAHRLIAECTGRNSNLVLADESGRIVDAIRHVNASMSRFREVLPGRVYMPPPQQDKLDPAEVTIDGLLARIPEVGRLSRAISDAVAGIGPAAARELAWRASGDSEALLDNTDRKSTIENLNRLMVGLKSTNRPTVLLNENGVPVDAFAFEQLSLPAGLQRQAASLSEAMDLCYAGRDAKDRTARRTQTLRRAVDAAIERTERKRAIQLEAIGRDADIDKARLTGDLLIANLYRIPNGAPSVTLEDFTDPDARPVTIALDQTLSASANAQRYYKQARKLKAAREAAVEQLRAADDSLSLLNALKLDLENCVEEPELAEVREQLARAGVIKKETRNGGKKPRKLPASRPYRYQSGDGTEIIVGKTSAQNDRVTAAARGDEMWLHAKDMPGSHVIIRREGDIPEAAMNDALMLAAWYSKGRGSANVPVDAAPRKYVKKPGGAPPGFVIYTHQRTYAVTPDEASVRAIKRLD